MQVRHLCTCGGCRARSRHIHWPPRPRRRPGRRARDARSRTPVQTLVSGLDLPISSRSSITTICWSSRRTPAGSSASPTVSSPAPCPRPRREQRFRARAAGHRAAPGFSRQSRRLPVLDVPQHRAARRSVLPRRAQCLDANMFAADSGEHPAEVPLLGNRVDRFIWDGSALDVRSQPDHAARVSE